MGKELHEKLWFENFLQNKKPTMPVFYFPGDGFEPPLDDPESSVLPLDDPGVHDNYTPNKNISTNL